MFFKFGCLFKLVIIGFIGALVYYYIIVPCLPK